MSADLNTLNHKLKELYAAYYAPEEQQAIDFLTDAIRATFGVSLDTLGKKKQYELVRDIVAVCAKYLLENQY